MRGWARLVAVVLAGVGAAGATRTAGPPPRPVRVVAAADLKFALDEAAAAFGRSGGVEIDLVYGSSGNLARQLLDGAPFDVFLSADEAYVDRLAAAGVAIDRGALYAVGRLAIFAPAGSPLAVDPALDGLKRLVQSGRGARVAIANPEHAPYGRAAEAVLRKRDLWTAIQPFLVMGENIAQAAQFAASGNAAGALVAYSLVLSPALQGRGTYALIPGGDHPPIRQRMALMKRAGPAAAQLYAYLQSPPARAIFRRYGFSLPDEGWSSRPDLHRGAAATPAKP